MSESRHRLDSEHDVAVAARDALQEVAHKISLKASPNAHLWGALAKQLKVDAKGVSRHVVFYDWMDGPEDSWEVPVLIGHDLSPLTAVYELMSEAELHLQEHFAASFLLVPAMLAGTDH